MRSHFGVSELLYSKDESVNFMLKPYIVKGKYRPKKALIVFRAGALKAIEFILIMAILATLNAPLD